MSDSLWPHGLHHTKLPCPYCPLEFAQTHVHQGRNKCIKTLDIISKKNTWWIRKHSHFTQTIGWNPNAIKHYFWKYTVHVYVWTVHAVFLIILITVLRVILLLFLNSLMLQYWYFLGINVWAFSIYSTSKHVSFHPWFSVSFTHYPIPPMICF